MVEVLAVLVDPATSIKSDIPGEFTVTQSASAIKVALADFISKNYNLNPPFDPNIMMTACHPSSKQSLHIWHALLYIPFLFPQGNNPSRRLSNLGSDILTVLVSPGNGQTDRISHSITRLSNIQQISSDLWTTSGSMIAAGAQGIASHQTYR